MAGLNNSIFDLPSSMEELRRPEDVIKVQTRKVNPTSGSKFQNFPGSDLVFNFTLSGNQHWIPSRSFVVIRNVIYVGDAGSNPVQPTNSDDIAPSCNMPSNLFDGCSLSVGSFNLGSISKNASQISACQQRLQKSAGFLDGAAKSIAFFDPNFNGRKNQITNNGTVSSSYGPGATLTGTVTVVAATAALVGVGTAFTTELQPGDQILTVGEQALTIKSIADDTNATITSSANTGEAGIQYKFLGASEPSGRSNKNESVYQPPLGIFKMGKALGSGRYELILRPKPDIVYKQSALSTLDAVTVLSGSHTEVGSLPTGNVEFVVEDIQFYVCVVDNFERNPSKYSVVLDLEETSVIPRQISGGAAVTENFTVSKSTFALTLALQDKRAGQDTLYSPSIFTVEDQKQNTLTNLQISYAGENRPQPAANPQFGAGVDYMTHRYLETGVEDLAFFDTGGMLEKKQWRELGEIYHFQWRKSGDDISTNVDAMVEYDEFTGDLKHNLLLFHHFRRIIEYSVENGQVTSFLSQDA